MNTNHPRRELLVALGGAILISLVSGSPRAEAVNGEDAVLRALERRPGWLDPAERCPADAIPELEVEVTEAAISCESDPRFCLARCKIGDAEACYGLAHFAEAGEVETGLDLHSGLFHRACKLGVSSGCTNRAAAMLNEAIDRLPSHQIEALKRGDLDPRVEIDEEIREVVRCAYRTFRRTCARMDPWGCTMQAQLLTRGFVIEVDLEQASLALEGSCLYGVEDPACRTAWDLKDVIAFQAAEESRQ